MQPVENIGRISQPDSNISIDSSKELFVNAVKELSTCTDELISLLNLNDKKNSKSGSAYPKSIGVLHGSIGVLMGGLTTAASALLLSMLMGGQNFNAISPTLRFFSLGISVVPGVIVGSVSFLLNKKFFNKSNVERSKRLSLEKLILRRQQNKELKQNFFKDELRGFANTLSTCIANINNDNFDRIEAVCKEGKKVLVQEEIRVNKRGKEKKKYKNNYKFNSLSSKRKAKRILDTMSFYSNVLQESGILLRKNGVNIQNLLHNQNLSKTTFVKNENKHNSQASNKGR